MDVKIGRKIEDFKLSDQDGNQVSLSDFEGKKVLLSFHPLAWTGVCTNQMEALEKNFENFTDNNTVPLGISVDPVPSKKAWAEDMGLDNVQILSDFWPHGDLAKNLDIFIDSEGISGRVNILLDDEREVKWFKEYDLSELPDIDEVLKEVRRA